MTPVGFIGLGQIGTEMARRLLDWPAGLVVHDARPEAMTPLTDAGAEAASSPRDLAERAGIISVMVRDDAQVDEVLAGPSGILASASPGAVVAIHSTITDATAERLAGLAQPYGVSIVDAPVSGGAVGAQHGTLAVLAGGGAEAIERCRAPFGHWANHVMHAGPPGAGTRAKVARNLLHFVAFSAAAEAQRLAEAAGIDLTELGAVVRHSDAVTGGPGAIMLRPTTAPMAADDGLRPILGHARDLGTKDLGLAIELGDRLGVELPLARHALDNLESDLGLGKPGTEEA
ncbi:3-hydroxyisobutyrate dehydrogenase [Haloechinothrix alba]|uniref:3-hydroxyisobutyrate dehydrogenase n=2 Tax=Haloechinothrix alba TaxID=664784 RepID=A0A239A157_9PSEU|nr:3-hydroxyisobutyrate dehydrogenase [Haloechinothrix alba]